MTNQLSLGFINYYDPGILPAKGILSADKIHWVKSTPSWSWSLSSFLMNPSVLIIDANASVRTQIQKALEASGYRVIKAASANEALAKLYLERPCLAIGINSTTCIDMNHLQRAMQSDTLLADIGLVVAQNPMEIHQCIEWIEQVLTTRNIG